MYLPLDWHLLNPFCYLELTHSMYRLLGGLQHPTGLWVISLDLVPKSWEHARDRASAQAPRESDSGSLWEYLESSRANCMLSYAYGA